MNRPKRTRLSVIIIVIMGRMVEAVNDQDSAMESACRNAVKQVPATDEVYLIPESAWSMEQAAVDAAAMALCDAFDGGEWPDCTALADLVNNWEDAVKSL